MNFNIKKKHKKYPSYLLALLMFYVLCKYVAGFFFHFLKIIFITDKTLCFFILLLYSNIVINLAILCCA